MVLMSDYSLSTSSAMSFSPLSASKTVCLFYTFLRNYAVSYLSLTARY